MPSPGTIKVYQEPRGPWVRVDSACYTGYQVLPFYDSLLAKLVVWGRDRKEAIARGKVALESYVIEGLQTTIPFHLALLADEKFASGEVDTKYVEAVVLKDFMQKGKPAPVQPAAAPAEKNGHAEPSIERVGPRNFEVEVEKRMFKVAVTELASEDSRSRVQSLVRPDLKLPLSAVQRDVASALAPLAVAAVVPVQPAR